MYGSQPPPCSRVAIHDQVLPRGTSEVRRPGPIAVFSLLRSEQGWTNRWSTRYISAQPSTKEASSIFTTSERFGESSTETPQANSGDTAWLVEMRQKLWAPASQHCLSSRWSKMVSFPAMAVIDTTPRAAALQLRLYREAGPSRRAQIAVDLSDAVRETTLAGIRLHPDDA